jgi:outer membrane protein OmpA-like peptidoglycan-associated protein
MNPLKKLKNHSTAKVLLMAGLLLSTALLETSCNASKRTKGAIIGAAAGAAAGAALGKNNRAVAMVLGAGIGGVAGGLIGQYMDKQAEEIQQDLEGAKVERIGEGIVVTFDSGLLFDFDSYALRQETRSNLDELAETLKKYDKTEVIIFGHTDSDGNPEYNLDLSEKRAGSVENYLLTQAVAAKRLLPEGLGESDPVATNESDAGRQLNRRVELTIIADKKLIRDAKKGKVPEA